jgi:probable rRNA maturation factor
MTVRIQVQSEPEFRKWELPIIRAANTVLDQLMVDSGSVTIVLTDADEIKRLNQAYAGEDHATDVLSFPSGEIDPESGIPYLGDIMIAVPIAQMQAEEKGHDLTGELCLLAIHGTLHLLGYDHSSQDEKARMWPEQARALRSLGIQDIAVNGV